MFSTPAKGGFSGLALTAWREGPVAAAGTPLGAAPNAVLGSALKTCARRLEVLQPSAIKEGAAVNFTRALDHFTLFDKVVALEVERRCVNAVDIMVALPSPPYVTHMLPQPVLQLASWKTMPSVFNQYSTLGTCSHAPCISPRGKL